MTFGLQEMALLPINHLLIILLITLFFISAMLIWWVIVHVQYTLENVFLYGIIFATLAISIIWLFIIVIPCTKKRQDPFLI
jgi:hypothetical protein